MHRAGRRAAAPPRCRRARRRGRRSTTDACVSGQPVDRRELLHADRHARRAGPGRRRAATSASISSARGARRVGVEVADRSSAPGRARSMRARCASSTSTRRQVPGADRVGELPRVQSQSSAGASLTSRARRHVGRVGLPLVGPSLRAARRTTRRCPASSTSRSGHWSRSASSPRCSVPQYERIATPRLRFRVERHHRVRLEHAARPCSRAAPAGPGTLVQTRLKNGWWCTSARREPEQRGRGVLGQVERASAAPTACSRSLRSVGRGAAPRAGARRGSGSPTGSGTNIAETRLPSGMRSLVVAHRHRAEHLQREARGAARRATRAGGRARRRRRRARRR